MQSMQADFLAAITLLLALAASARPATATQIWGFGEGATYTDFAPIVPPAVTCMGPRCVAQVSMPIRNLFDKKTTPFDSKWVLVSELSLVVS